MLSILISRNGEILKTEDTSLIQLALEDSSQKVWVDFEEPSEEEFLILKEVFQFDPLALQEVQGFVGAPKIQLFENYAFLVLHRLFYNLETEVCDPREFEVFLSDRFIVTSHSRHLSRTFEAARLRVEHHPKRTLARGPSFVLAELVQLTLKDYQPIMDQWEDTLDEIEQRVLSGVQDQILDQILAFKKLAANLKRNLLPEREVLRQLYEKTGSSYLPAASRPHFKNLNDEMNAFLQAIESLRDHASSVFEVYATMLTLESNRISQNLNFIMQRLTIATSIFLPLTFIVGVYGMNFNFMPELNWKWSYPLLLIFMFSLAVGMFWFFKKKKWL